MNSRIAVVIPNWNGAALLGRVLGSLAAQTRPPDRVLVVDNGSEDSSREVAARCGAEVIALDRNYGFAVAVNRGIEAVSEESIAIINNDVELEPDWLDRLEAGIGDAPFAVGRILSADNRGRLDGCFDLVCRGACAWRAGSGSPDSERWHTRRRVQFAPLTAALFRGYIFTRLGLLDESLESYMEDVEFGLRCASERYTGVYVPEAVAYHKGSATLGRWNARTVRNISRNQLLLVAKHYSPEMLRDYGWPIAVSQLLWGWLAARHGCGLAWLSGKCEAVRRFRSARRNVSHGTVVILRQVLEESERELLDLQRAGGFDTYWKLYFALTRGAVRR